MRVDRGRGEVALMDAFAMFETDDGIKSYIQTCICCSSDSQCNGREAVMEVNTWRVHV